MHEENKFPAILPIYGERALTFARGSGSYIYDEQDNAYLDFGSGQAVVNLGHCYQPIVDALSKQASVLWHTSNLYHVPAVKEFMEILVEKTFADTGFMCNSGTEAIECALKAIRSYHRSQGNEKKFKVIKFPESYHGRTFGAYAASDDKYYYPEFAPHLAGFIQADPEIDDIEKLISGGDIAGVIIEPIQGQGGVNVFSNDFMQGLHKLCKDNDVLLVLDCIQCGIGRAGTFLGYEHIEDIEPDICAVAKGIGGGFPLGVCLMTEEVGKSLKPGTHGSTFGGNPLAAVIGKIIVDEISQDSFLGSVKSKGDYLMGKVQDIADRYSVIKDVRGKGLMIGIEMQSGDLGKKCCDALRKEKVLILPTSTGIVRVFPPLNVSMDEINVFLESFLHVVSHL